MVTPGQLDIRVIAQRLADRRSELRLEQTEVAERAGLSRAYVSRLESGIVPNPKLLDLARVANVLDVPLASLVSPPGHAREIAVAEGADLLEQLADEPPEMRQTILSWLRQSVELSRRARQVRTN